MGGDRGGPWAEGTQVAVAAGSPVSAPGFTTQAPLSPAARGHRADGCKCPRAAPTLPEVTADAGADSGTRCRPTLAWVTPAASPALTKPSRADLDLAACVLLLPLSRCWREEIQPFGPTLPAGPKGCELWLLVSASEEGEDTVAVALLHLLTAYSCQSDQHPHIWLTRGSFSLPVQPDNADSYLNVSAHTVLMVHQSQNPSYCLY